MLSRPGILDVSKARRPNIIGVNQPSSTETMPDRTLGCPSATAAQRRVHCSSIGLLTSKIWSPLPETRMGPPRLRQTPCTSGRLRRWRSCRASSPRCRMRSRGAKSSGGLPLSPQCTQLLTSQFWYAALCAHCSSASDIQSYLQWQLVLHVYRFQLQQLTA